MGLHHRRGTKTRKFLGKLQQKEIDIQSIEKIEAKPIPFSSKVTLKQEEYQTLAMAAKQLVVHEKKERKLEKLLKTAERTILELKAKITKLTQELSKFLSISRKLETGRLHNRRIRNFVNKTACLSPSLNKMAYHIYCVDKKSNAIKILMKDNL